MPNGDAANDRTEVLDLHSESQVRLVGAVLRDGLGVGHAPKRPPDLDADLAEASGQGALDDLEDKRGRRERHLQVHLRELELAVGAERLVAEAAGDLDVAIEARDHQDLLEDLRRLRQGIELARVHTARDQEVPRALRRVDFVRMGVSIS